MTRTTSITIPSSGLSAILLGMNPDINPRKFYPIIVMLYLLFAFPPTLLSNFASPVTTCFREFALKVAPRAFQCFAEESVCSMGYR